MANFETHKINDRITLYHGDCRDVIPTLPPINTVLSDPPYGIEDMVKSYGRTQLHNYNSKEMVKSYGEAARTDARNDTLILNDKDLTVTKAAILAAAAKVTVGWVFAFYSPRNQPDVMRTFETLPWFGECIWDKGAPGLGNPLRYAHENVAIYKIGDAQSNPPALISELRASAINEFHPHQKPVEILCRLIEWATQPDDLVLDPFMGSGGTGVACAQLGRRFVGCELDPKYFAVSKHRIEQAAGQSYLF